MQLHNDDKVIKRARLFSFLIKYLPALSWFAYIDAWYYKWNWCNYYSYGWCSISFQFTSSMVLHASINNSIVNHPAQRSPEDTRNDDATSWVLLKWWIVEHSVGNWVLMSGRNGMHQELQLKFVCTKMPSIGLCASKVPQDHGAAKSVYAKGQD
jgi:hypothetical protein